MRCKSCKTEIDDKYVNYNNFSNKGLFKVTVYIPYIACFPIIASQSFELARLEKGKSCFLPKSQTLIARAIHRQDKYDYGNQNSP